MSTALLDLAELLQDGVPATWPLDYDHRQAQLQCQDVTSTCEPIVAPAAKQSKPPTDNATQQQQQQQQQQQLQLQSKAARVSRAPARLEVSQQASASKRPPPSVEETTPQQQLKVPKLNTSQSALADLIELYHSGIPVTWPPGFDYTSAKIHLLIGRNNEARPRRKP